MADYGLPSIIVEINPDVHAKDEDGMSKASDSIFGGGSITTYYYMGGHVSGSYSTWISIDSPTPVTGATNYKILYSWQK